MSGDDIAEEWVTLSGAGANLLRSNWIPFNLLDDNHIDFGETISPTFTATSAAFSPAAIPQVFVGYGGCLIVNDFDVLQPTGVSVEDFPYPNAGTGNGSVVISAQGPNNAAATYTIVLSGLSYQTIRSCCVGFPPARVEHLRTILIYMGNIVPEASGLPGDGPQFANYLDGNYPNPFNPTTRIRYGVKERAHVSLKVYNVAGHLVRTLVDGVQKPAVEYEVDWHGDNDVGQGVASGVYFYKLVTKNFSQTKKMVLLK
jgi:hypothetical protein